MKLKILWFSLFFNFLSSTAYSQNYGGSLVLTCIDAYCSNINGSQSPLYSTNNKDLDQARWAAYRYEFNQKYEQAVEQLKNNVESWAEEKKQSDKLSVAEFESLKTEALQKLESNLPKIPSNLPTWQQKRALNPYPSESAKLDLDKKLDAVWKSIETASPKKIADSLNQAMTSSIAPEDASETIRIEFARRQEFLQKELTLSQVTDSQGLLNFPFVDKSGIPLKTNAQTAVGNQIRKNLNLNYANTATTNAKCALQKLEECKALKDFNAGMELVLYTMDRWGSELRSLGDGENEIFSFHLKALETQLALASGVIEGSVEMIKGFEQMMIHPVDTINAIGSAIYNYDKTANALGGILANTWDSFKNGNAAERAKIIGRVGFEAASVFVPLTKVSWAEKIANTSKLAQVAFSKSAEILNVALKGGVKTADELAILIQVQKDLVHAGNPLTRVMEDLNRLKPEVLLEYTSAISEMGTSLTPTAQAYLAKQATYAAEILKGTGKTLFSKDELISMTNGFMQIEAKMATAPVTSVREIVWRGVDKSYNVLKENIFNFHEGSFLSNGRYSSPGDLAIYSARGEEALAKQIISKELANTPLDQIDFAAKEFTFNKVLDLTDTNTKKIFDISDESLLTSDSYELTHQLGAAARNNGFQAIIAPNKFNTTNLIILR